MALGDVTLFNTAKLGLLNGTHDLDTHVLKLAIVTNAVVPVETQAAPTLATYTEVAVVASGYAVAGGTTITISLTESAGVVTFNPTINPTWPAVAGGDANAYWGILYNDTSVIVTTLTGSINPTASTAVVGVGTLFTTELIVGDRIFVSGETRTVATITDNLNLTVTAAFTDVADDATPDRIRGKAIGFVDLGGPIDMASSPTTITWHPSGIFTLQVL